MALAGHIAPDGDQAGGTEAVFLGAEQRGDHHVARASQAAVGAQPNTPAQTVAHQHLLRLGHTQLPRATGVLDARQRAGAGTTVEAGNEHVIGVGLGHTCSYGADAGLGDQLDPDPTARVDALEVVDQLGQVFDGVDVVVRWRRDQAGARHGMAQAGDQVSHLVGRQLTAFARLAALSHLDLHLFGVSQVACVDAEAS